MGRLVVRAVSLAVHVTSLCFVVHVFLRFSPRVRCTIFALSGPLCTGHHAFRLRAPALRREPIPLLFRGAGAR